MSARSTDLSVGQLSRWGFMDASAALASWRNLVDAFPTLEVPILRGMAESADPDSALTGLSRVLERTPDARELIASLLGDTFFTRRLVSVMGASTALADHLARHPGDCFLLADRDVVAMRPTADALRASLLAAVGAAATSEQPRASADAAQATDQLRVAYRRALLSVAARDLTSHLTDPGDEADVVEGGAEVADVTDIAAELADLAAAALEGALAIARTEVGEDSLLVKFAVIGMGKCGGRELNYVSDVDVIYVVEPSVGHDAAGHNGPGPDEHEVTRIGDRLAAALSRACSAPTVEGALWEVDAGLRPEGKSGALTRTLASHVAYYERWAKTWEFQALLKARPVAGDRELGERYVAAISPLVWAAASRDGFVVDVQQMRRRVEAHVPTAEADRELKLGPGGLRDIEFAVQLLQLVHGRGDSTLRSGNTIRALGALADGGYVGRDDAASLGQAYRFLRTLEHRLQLRRLRRTHLMPTDPTALRIIGRSLGYTSRPVEQLTAQWRTHALEVRRLHEKLFYRPLLQAVARLDAGESRLTVEAAESRMEALGYADPKGALRHIEALTAGVSRRAAIQRTLLPVMLGWFADAPDPDAGLLGFRRVSEALGSTHWYLALLRDAGATAERLARILASSRFATDLLLRAPDAVALLSDDDALRPRTLEELTSEMQSIVGRSTSTEASATSVRAIRRRELFRISAAEILDEVGPEASGPALTDVAEAGMQTMVDAVLSSLASGSPPTQLAVIAMGRFGGRELGLGSDLDVLFVHDPLPGADEQEASRFAIAAASELGRLLSVPSADPPMVVDADLRPEGRSGPLARTLASYQAYYERWSLTWESQALLRASPVAGDADVGRAFCDVIDRLRWPSGGLTEQQVIEIRRIKARVEAERLPRGADPALHTKLGRGGLADVEWTVQLLQMQHASAVTALKTTNTLAALSAATAEGLIDAGDAEVLRSAWLLATSIRDAIMVAKGRPSDSLPRDSSELRLVAGVLGYDPSRPGDLVEDYRRVSRRSRAVVEKVFYT